MVDLPWLCSFNGVYIDIYIHILSWVSNPTRNDTRPFVKNPGRVHNVYFFVAWFFGFPDGSQGEWYQGPSQGGSNWNTGERSWAAKNINVLMEELLQYLQSADTYAFGLNAIWIWPGEWWQFLLIMFFLWLANFYHDPVAGNDPIWRA